MVRSALTVLGLITLGCSNAAEPTSVATAAQAATGSIAIAIDGACADHPSDGFFAEPLRLEGGQLVIDATFSGGCKQHTFAACWDGAFQESLPVQAQIRLLHDAQNDNCRAILFRQVRVDVTALADAYRDAYGAAGTVLTSVADVPGSVAIEVTSARLSTDELAAAFPEAAKGAVYMSEGDYAPVFVAAPAASAADAPLSTGLVVAALGEAIVAQYAASGTEVTLDALAFKMKKANPSLRFLNDLAAYADDDDDNQIESAKAFGRLRDLWVTNLTDLRVLRVGPKGEDGSLAEDGGLYFYLVVGKTGDGQLAGFVVGSVET